MSTIAPAAVDDVPVGKAEISQLGRVQLRTVHTWRQRNVLPPPDYASVNGSEAWKKSTILLWMAETGRLKNAMRPEADEFCRAVHGVSLDVYLERADAR